MRVKNSLDWDVVSGQMRDQMHTAPQSCRKDLARMIGAIEGMVQRLANEEVDLRRNRKDTSAKHQSLLERINQAIEDFEKWLMLAHLQHG